MLKNLTGKYGVKFIVAKWKCFSIVIHVDIFVAMVVSANGYIGSDICVHVKEFSIWLASATKVEHSPVHIGFELVQFAVKPGSNDKKRVKQKPKESGFEQGAVVLLL